MNENTLIRICAPPILTLIVCGICYGRARAIRQGKPLTRLQRGMILYATIFSFGTGYLIMFQDGLASFFHWKNTWIAALVLWGLALAVIAWQRHRPSRAG